jgi:hypothetical protein
VSIVYLYLLYALVQEQDSKRPITHKKFRQSLVESLVHERMSTNGRMHKKLSEAHHAVAYLKKD